MSKNRKRYQQMELCMTGALLFALTFFIVYLIASGTGTVWLKVIAAILSILVSILCLGFLYINKELLHQRSLWMSVSAFAIVVCIIFSLILNFPSPNPFKQADKSDISQTTINSN